MSEETLEILQNIVLLVLQLAIPPLLALIATAVRRWIETRENERWFQVLRDVVADAVAAAEQLGLSGQLSEFAESKLDYAIAYVEQALAAAGYPVDLDPFIDVIRGMIEAEVRRQFPSEGQPPAEAAPFLYNQP